MPLDIYPTARRELNDYVATQPAVGPGIEGFGDLGDLAASFQMAINANAHDLGTLRAQRNQLDVVNDWLDAFEAKTGYRPDAFGKAAPGSFDFETLNKAFQTEKTSRPDFDLTGPPTREQAWKAAVDIERGYVADNARRTGRPQTFLGTIGSATGTMAEPLVSPITILSSGFFGIAAAGFLAAALRDALVIGAQQGAVSTGGYPVAHALNPDYGPGDVLSEAIFASVGGRSLGSCAGRLVATWGAL